MMADAKVLRSQGITRMEVHIDNSDPIDINILVVESKLLVFD